MKKELEFLPLFEQFIRDTLSGRRLKPNGQKIKPQTVNNYRYTYKLLREFPQSTGFVLRIRPVNKMAQRQLKVEMNYWKKFYSHFSSFLFRVKGCFDNYVGNIFKMIKVFFNYLSRDKLIQVGEFHKCFYVRKEEIPIVTLTPRQLQFLISDKGFEDTLSKSMKRTKDIFVFGCTVALRVSDLFNVRFKDIQEFEGHYYLSIRSIKTDTLTQVKLPLYAMTIVNKYRRGRAKTATLFPAVCKNQFNKNVRNLAEKAGWIDVVGKFRSRNGKQCRLLTSDEGKLYRFCDLLSSHTMRRTAVTTMLMLGMPENVVRKISGHSASSREFYRYVSFAQGYLDQEIDKVHQKLVTF